MDPDTRYATTRDGVYIAYQVAGEGPVDVAWQTDFANNIDVMWEGPFFGPVFRGIASFARLILHDRRGTGLSSRNVSPPNLETRVADLRVVLDAVGSERPVLAGFIEGGAPAVLLAATNPERVQSIVWWASGQKLRPLRSTRERARLTRRVCERLRPSGRRLLVTGYRSASEGQAPDEAEPRCNARCRSEGPAPGVVARGPGSSPGTRP